LSEQEPERKSIFAHLKAERPRRNNSPRRLNLPSLRIFASPNAYICDAEYAPAELFKSDNPKAPRNKGQQAFCKFYDDEGWRFIKNNFPQCLIFHDMLRQKTIGVNKKDLLETRKPDEKLKELVTKKPKDELVNALRNVLAFTVKRSSLSINDFGIFGSMLHDFHHPKFSDIDLTIYGRDKVALMRETLQELYRDYSSLLSNEFETDESIQGKRWRFQNLSPKEFIWHQRRKLIYALFHDKKSRRIIKTEFEPVRDWKEISSDYDPEVTIVRKGWVRMLARVSEDIDALFIPSVYGIEPLKVLDGAKGFLEVARVVSYIEEFRMQAFAGETVYVEGNLEEVNARKGSFHQIALTYCPRYYEQVLRVAHQA
jgi:predicted nucleotidyltransferase